MPNKTFPIMLEVEDIALGPVLRKLNEMPGIARLHFDLGKGGEGPGKQALQQKAARLSGPNIVQAAMAFLSDGEPRHISEIAVALGGKKTRAYSAMTQLRKAGLAQGGPFNGSHQLSAVGFQQANGGGNGHAPPAALPRSKSGRRIKPGAGPALLRQALAGGGLASPALYRTLIAGGMPKKSIAGALARAKRDGLIKTSGARGKSVYALTAKGEKQEAAHG